MGDFNDRKKAETADDQRPGSRQTILRDLPRLRIRRRPAAKRGDIPTIRVGRLLRVPVRLLEALIDDAAMKRRHRAARDQVTAA